MEPKLPPSVIDLEDVVLGAILLSPSSYLRVADLLESECFYKEANAIVWEAISTSFNEGRPIDMLSITNTIRSMGKIDSVGGAVYIAGLTSRIVSEAHIEHHAMVIKEKWMLRKIISEAYDMSRKAHSDSADPFDLMNKAISTFDAISVSIEKTKELSLKAQLKNTVSEIENAAKNNFKVGDSTGFGRLDLLGGLVKTDLIILGAKPAMGKTALSIQICMNNALMYDHPVVIFELEMSYKQLWMREISRQTAILHNNVRSGRLNEFDWQNINKKVGDIVQRKIEVYDTAGQTMSYMRRKLMSAKNKHGSVGLIMVDYLQLVRLENSHRNQTRADEVSEISRRLKELAKEFDAPIIALSQLSRDKDKEGKIPIMSDLKNSGDVEANADKIWLLHRPEYYGISELEDGSSSQGVAQIFQAKNRSGETGEVRLYFDGSRVSFSDSSECFNAPF